MINGDEEHGMTNVGQRTPSMSSMADYYPPPTLQEHVVSELDRILSEQGWPRIQTALIRQLQDVVAAWPDVTYLGQPLTR